MDRGRTHDVYGEGDATFIGGCSGTEIQLSIVGHTLRQDIIVGGRHVKKTGGWERNGV